VHGGATPAPKTRVSPQKRKKNPKKKIKLIKFAFKFCYFYSFDPSNLFFFLSLAPPNLKS
jgi:hypothetical protein